MNCLSLFRSFILVSILSVTLIAQTSVIPASVHYIHPVPDSRQNSVETNIAIRMEERFIPSSVSPSLISLIGGRSGRHNAEVVLSDDFRTIVVNPEFPFMNDESVTIRYNGGAPSVSGRTIPSFSFQFFVSKRQGEPVDVMAARNAELVRQVSAVRRNSSPLFDKQGTFPPNMLTVSYSAKPSPGMLFLSNFILSASDYIGPPFLMIVDNTGTPLFTRQMVTVCYDFKRQPNGQLTYWDSKFLVLDSSYTKVEQIECRNGYSTDPHELQFLPNGHALLLGFDVQAMDLRKLVPGGRTDANVIGLVIQELDKQRNVVFQWRSFDHYKIADATNIEFSDYTIDAVHGNALDVDKEGNILLSSRNLDEITKIDRNTGAILWRLGGKNNQFTFLNDSIGFSRQHDVRVLPNGNITLFDNGNYHTPQFSRALEYAVNAQKKTATLVWYYRNAPDIFGNALGSVQRLPNGNTLIGWGAANPTLTEVTQGGTKVLEMTLPSGVYSYRVYRYDWVQRPTFVRPLEQIPASLSLEQNFPNPFNPSTSIRFTLPSDGSVRLTVHDILGKEVAVLDEREHQAGMSEVMWDASSVSSGIYFYRLRTEQGSITKRMLLVK
jgi:hypothetical protein